MKINKSMVTAKVADMGETIRSLRDIGLPRGIYNELSKNDEPELDPYQLCVLGDVINEDPLDLISAEDVANLKRVLPMASERPNNPSLKSYLVKSTSLEEIENNFISAQLNPPSEIDIESRRPDLNLRESKEWAALRDSNILKPRVRWINLLPERIFVEVAPKLKKFEETLGKLSSTKSNMDEHLTTLDKLLEYSEKIDEEGLDVFFKDARYEIFYKRLERPLNFTEVSIVDHSDPEIHPGQGVPEYKYEYELHPIDTIHCFIVVPIEIARKKGCVIFNALPSSERTSNFWLEDAYDDACIDDESWKRYKKPFVSTEEPGD